MFSLDVAMPNWKDLEITAKDQEDYRQYVLSTKVPGDQNDQTSGYREVRAIPGQIASAQNPVFIPPKSVFVVPILLFIGIRYNLMPIKSLLRIVEMQFCKDVESETRRLK